MLSLIEVQCPHCGARGQIMLPPLGSIIVGPCPECHNMVMIFSGRVMKLDNRIMTEGDRSDKHEHLMAVLNTFLRDRVNKLLDNEEAESKTAPEDDAEVTHQVVNASPETEGPVVPPLGKKAEPITGGPITPSEMDTFLNVELRLLDNKEYFKTVFE